MWYTCQRDTSLNVVHSILIVTTFLSLQWLTFLAVKVSVKGGLVDGLDWSQGEHIFTNTAVFPIPDGARKWEGMPDSFGKEGDEK